MNGVSRSLLVVAALLPAATQAQEATPTPPFNYTYVELGYDEAEYAVGSVEGLDGDGLTLSGSFEITEDWHAYASYNTSDLDVGLDVDTWIIGAGYRYPLRDNIDIYGRVLYLNTEADVSGVAASRDDDGLGVLARLRMRVSNEFEVEGGILYTDIVDTDTSLQASARYYFTDEFSAGLGITFAGDADGIGINARFSF